MRSICLTEKTDIGSSLVLMNQFIYKCMMIGLYMFVFPKDWRKSAETLEYARKEFLHYFISSVFTTRNAVLPLAWLSYTKYVLGMDYVPSDFQSLALKILEWFDLERYQAAYHLPQEEYDAIKHDLPLVINQLKNYPVDKFAPPIGDKC